MDAWIYVVVAAVITVVPAVALTLLCRTETEKGEERRFWRASKAKAIAQVAAGGGAAVANVPLLARHRENLARQDLSPGAEARSDECRP
jgi:hypothetical protein